MSPSDVVKDVEALANGFHEGPFRCGFETACEEMSQRLNTADDQVAELLRDAIAFRTMVNLQMYIGFRQGTVEVFSDGILAASVFKLGHDALSATRNAIADHAAALNECSKKVSVTRAKDAAP